jgi:hypothetical protein
MSSQQNNNNNSSAESILTPLQEVLDAWEDNDLESCSENCLFLLKKRKGVMDAALTDSVQKILLQCWLQLEHYSKIDEWIQANNITGHKGLALYARYRSEDYDKVSKSATKESLLEQHLLAQSYFHLNQPAPALKVYGDIILANNDGGEDDQAQMETLSNALAVLASTAVPFVPVSDSGNWVGRSETFLKEHTEFSDLALNLGLLKFLGSSPNAAIQQQQENWLEHAEDNADPDDLPVIETNLAWSDHFWYTNDYSDNVDVYSSHTDGPSARAAVATLNQSLLREETTFPTTQPHPKWNLLQLRMYWYNRAVAQYKEGKMVECQESCQSLKKTLGGGNDVSSSSNKKNSKKQLASTTLWWEARAEVLVAHAQDKQSKTSSSSSSSSSPAVTKLEQKLEFLKGQSSSPIIDHAVAHVQLHLYLLKNANNANNNNTNKKQQLASLLKSLPESIQSRPAVQATLSAVGGGEQASSSSSSSNKQKNKKNNKKSSSPEDQAVALFGQGKYKEAAELYEQTLPAVSKSDPDQLVHHLWRVQALARSSSTIRSDQHHYDEAEKLWKELEASMSNAIDIVEDAALDGEALEQKALPRSATSGTKIIGTENSANQSTRSKESVLRQRTKNREAYLKQLESKGEYNPDRPTKPNAERWIPKHERSRARGGRRNNHNQSNNNRSAQGGGSQADAQRLDAAARRAGTVPASSGPSTANMKVTAMGGGKRRGRR